MMKKYFDIHSVKQELIFAYPFDLGSGQAVSNLLDPV